MSIELEWKSAIDSVKELLESRFYDLKVDLDKRLGEIAERLETLAEKHDDIRDRVVKLETKAEYEEKSTKSQGERLGSLSTDILEVKSNLKEHFSEARGELSQKEKVGVWIRWLPALVGILPWIAYVIEKVSNR